MNMISGFAFVAGESEEERRAKNTIFLVAGSCCFFGVIWSAMYYWIFGWGLTAALPLGYAILVGASISASHASRNISWAIYAQIICIIYITAFIQWSIGGLFDSGFVMAWALLGPIGALVFFPRAKSIIWFVLYLINVVITLVFDDFFAAQGYDVSEAIQTLFFFMNISISSLVIFLFAGYFVANAASERQRADALLLNTLPKEVVPVLKSGQETIADYFETSTIMFCDMVGSTPMFEDMKPAEVVDWLNEVFTMFDKLTEKYGLEKIRTIGDNYMVAAGVPTPRPDHATAMASLALEMLQGLNDIPARAGKSMAFRFGINSGPVVAGIIGKTKFQYDIWGDTVNVASRMESHGEAGNVHISAATHDLIKDEFDCLYRGKTPIKGKDDMDTWYIVGPK
ncbi:MAG: adenylate/guanylate cyclase domain-containing protein [Alphaproteobacteria bacterium]|nr:adenylate/guanylate cyclase domain-containing protein [Alphaproteobacteria bacterium]